MQLASEPDTGLISEVEPSLRVMLLRVWSQQDRPGRPSPDRNAEPQAHGPTAGRGVDPHGDGAAGDAPYPQVPASSWNVPSAPSWLTPLALLAHGRLPQPHAHLSRCSGAPRTPPACLDGREPCRLGSERSQPPALNRLPGEQSSERLGHLPKITWAPTTPLSQLGTEGHPSSRLGQHVVFLPQGRAGAGLVIETPGG